ncbi:hypothetical protein [Schlesneria sp. T3-172]|uniref:hypothetical protein n=1 Tax=Schlesneria sphaerica TaxID=3373610 RepID=UPI0037C765A0
MPRPRNSIPKFSIDRNGRAFTKVDGRFVSLGRGDNPESRRRYAVLLTEHTGLAAIASPATEKKPAVTVNELLLRFVTEELPRYSTSDRCNVLSLMLNAVFTAVEVDDTDIVVYRTIATFFPQHDF